MAKGVELKGFEEIERILDALPKALGPKVVQKCLRDGVKPLVKTAKENSSHADVTGNLTRSIGVINGKGENKASITMGPRRGKGKNAKGWHAHLVEYGTAPHLIKPKDGKVVKFGENFASETMHPGSKAQPFLRPAWDTTNGMVRIEIARSLREVLDSNFKGVFK